MLLLHVPLLLHYYLYYTFCKVQHDTTPLGKYHQVAIVENFFNIIHQAHYKDTGHGGAKKTLAKVIDSSIPCTYSYMMTFPQCCSVVFPLTKSIIKVIV